MPVVRSAGDIPSEVEQDTLDQEAGGDAQTPVYTVRRPMTRMQARKEAIEREDSNIRRIVDNSLQGFRNEISDMIAESFRNFTLANQEPIGQDRLTRTERLDPDRTERGIQDNECEDYENHRSGQGNRENRYLDNRSDRNSERVLNIIRNWKVRFTGIISEVTVDEFIYRINSLTNANLNGDFNLLCEHAHILFEDKALKWFWRFHRSCVHMHWDKLCDAMKRQYGDDKTDFDIRDDILQRKQRHNETFDEFHEAIMVLCDKLHTPLSEYELCETLQRNLRPEIRHDILHLEIARVSHLRRAIRRHEKFVRDMASTNVNKRGFHRMQVSEVISKDEQFVEDNNLDDDDTDICMIVKSGKCWNCDKIGHSFIDCLEPRNIFCYGCGAKNMFKPKCPNCCVKRGNVTRDVRAKKDGHPRIN